MNNEIRPSGRREYLRKYQLNWVKEKRLIWLEANGPCKKCGSWEKLEVDHVDPANKVSHAVWSWSKERRAAELKKCQVLCQVCHREKTVAFLRRKMTGSRGRPNKLTESAVLQIITELKAGSGLREIGRRHGINHATVIDIRDGRTWGWLTKQKQKAEQLNLFEANK